MECSNCKTEHEVLFGGNLCYDCHIEKNGNRIVNGGRILIDEMDWD